MRRQTILAGLTRGLVLGAATALATIGCSAATPPGPAADDVTLPRPVTVVAEDYVYTHAPTEIPAGIVDLTFENTGTVTHEVAMAGIGDTPIDRFLEDLRAGAFRPNGKPQPDYLDQVIVPSGAEAGETIQATFAITEGRYALFCVFTDPASGDKKAPHYERGMLREPRSRAAIRNHSSARQTGPSPPWTTGSRWTSKPETAS